MHGANSDLRLKCWITAPEGADVVNDFSDWMQRLVQPDPSEDESGEE